MIDMAHVMVEQGRRLANTTARLEAQQFNQEIPRIRQALERIVNKSAAEPTPAPAPQGNLCGGRMSDGSSCEIPRDTCFLRHEGNYYKAVNKVPDDSSARGLVHNRSELLREVERTFGNKSHTVKSKSGGGRSKSRGRAGDEKGDELYLRGPQYPTRLTHDRRLERWARLTRFLEAVDQGPDVDDQGPDNPPDDHPDDDAHLPDSPSAGGAAEMIDV
ncbi:hypothetical protein AC1031_000519 [Aphanomyces cochlioides]|nr:hypothetical protein AC1031_000517 [Aphanomyces cochlioides]KAG9416119.1 hypothetical protein AC1031_000519 [Aphanomyces cochlioides]